MSWAAMVSIKLQKSAAGFQAVGIRFTLASINSRQRVISPIRALFKMPISPSIHRQMTPLGANAVCIVPPVIIVLPLTSEIACNLGYVYGNITHIEMNNCISAAGNGDADACSCCEFSTAVSKYISLAHYQTQLTWHEAS